MTAASRQRIARLARGLRWRLLIVWQILSCVYTAEAQPGEPMVAGWGTLFTSTLLSLSDYWQGGFGVPAVADGAPRTYLAALLSILSHSPATIARLASGLALGGAARPCARPRRVLVAVEPRLVDLPTQFLRTLPLLAMVPLFQLWFGTYFFGQVLFVAYGIGVIVFAGIVNAVRNVPQIYLDNARSLGASRTQLYRTVILPAILPAMRSSSCSSLGAGWGAVLGAEYLGAQSGLGYIIVYAQQFALLDRMFLIALLFILYTSASYWAIERLFTRLLAWAPSSQSRQPMSDRDPHKSARALVERTRRGALPPSRRCAPHSSGSRRANPTCGPSPISTPTPPSLRPSAPTRASGGRATRAAAWTACRGQGHHRHARLADRIRRRDLRRPTPGRDATIVKRLRAAGAIVIGKTVTSQFALFVAGADAQSA